MGSASQESRPSPVQVGGGGGGEGGTFTWAANSFGNVFLLHQ